MRTSLSLLIFVAYLTRTLLCLLISWSISPTCTSSWSLPELCSRKIMPRRASDTSTPRLEVTWPVSNALAKWCFAFLKSSDKVQ